ncbi:MAG: AtpZ/AtpI family protein [Nocardioidaceae bacterium]|nr:MAG: AtpZ/AtpI family protein [Nocardioidaceae bacterium]
MTAGIVRPAMTQQQPPSAQPPQGPQQQPQQQLQGDPWHAFGYVVSGVAVYGFLGWLADRWLGTTFLVAIGILFGAGLGVYQTFARFRQPDVLDEQRQERGQAEQPRHDQQQQLREQPMDNEEETR